MLSRTLSWAGWILVAGLSLYYFQSNAISYLNYSSTSYDNGYRHILPFIFTHVLCGTLALLLGPLQFIGTIRSRYTRIHRLIGKIYLISVLVGSPVALYIAVIHTFMTIHDHIGAVGLSGLAIAWFITSAMAFWAIKKGNISQHREWMIRSYTVTFGFTSFRLFFYILPAISSLTVDEIGPIMSWACWAVPLLFTEIFIQGVKIKQT
jgi:uncharacterized membrane protein